MQYRSCWNIENACINFNGSVDGGSRFIAFCCEPLGDIPAIAFEETAEQTARCFLELRTKMIDLSKAKDKALCAGCADCTHYKSGEHGRADGLIHYINLSMYPAPCQSNCFYCGFNLRGQTKYRSTKEAEQGYEKLFSMLEYYDEYDLIAKDARWQISTGEIAIHPYKDRILDLVKDQEAEFRTNCFIFNEGIAGNLASNPNSFINLSIDAGTPETWLKVKRVDNFYEVTDNLVSYYMSCTRPGQITLKYIVLPGVNDNMRDYESLAEIMNILEVQNLTLSREMGSKYNSTSQQRVDLVIATAYLAAVLKKSGKTFDFHHGFIEIEREHILAKCEEIIQAGKV